MPDIIAELRDFGIDPLVHDPMADPEEAVHEYGAHLPPNGMTGEIFDGIILAVRTFTTWT